MPIICSVQLLKGVFATFLSFYDSKLNIWGLKQSEYVALEIEMGICHVFLQTDG